MVEGVFINFVPYNNSKCTGESIGIGYSFQLDQSQQCIPGISESSQFTFNQSQTLTQDVGMTVNLFGLIASIDYYSSSTCSPQSKVNSTAYKHNGCYLIQLQSIQQWSQIIIIESNDNPLPISTDSPYALVYSQYTSEQSCQQSSSPSSSSYQYYYTISNNSTIEIDQQPPSLLFTCSTNQQPTLSIDCNVQEGQEDCKTLDIGYQCINNNNNIYSSQQC
ncbi:hypothetical protein DFA_09702 [Cavenderia fasciculata]|uniref:Uncharacterized protein n=1 Tax=Cavenderia fasciculata TaxID=261658 RepID=F4Q8D0_CACFS|nr:uncharacterized protein DFA_09702 [Cavenderia fasciculata]EGG16030.1 hypothetical protein DFA_09702 [Cavenderia fasciculata]|eukprot:XP_004352355.1 hypothetical protein DFA_09702 [Cavenderia fasciculata]